MMKRLVIAATLAYAIPAQANIIDCRIEGVVITINENFGTWSAPNGAHGDLTVSRPRHWEWVDHRDTDVRIQVKAQPSGRAVVRTFDEGGRREVMSTQCTPIATGRTPGR
jgi:hypothetical protein